MKTLRSAVVMMAVTAVCAQALAQRTPAQPPAPSPATGRPAAVAEKPADLLSTASKPLFAAAVTRAEDAVIPLVLQRASMSGDARTRLEAQIDLLVLERWLASVSGNSELQSAAAWLRAQQVRQAVAALQSQLATDGDRPLDSVRQLAAKNLHQITADLPEAADVSRMDAVCRLAGISLWELGTGQAASPATTSGMRPASIPALPQDAAAAAAPRPRSSAVASTAPADLIPRLSVTPVLRQQLIRTLDAVQRPEVYELTREEARQLERTLKEAIDIAAGLASNAGVDIGKRMELERELGEALALLQDRRLKEIGRRKIDGMGRYRQVLSAIIRLNLSEQNYKLLAPAFEHAERSPDDAKRLIPTVEKFVAYCSAYDALPATVQYNADAASLKAVQKAYDDSRKSFETARNAFLGDVEQLGGGGISSTSAADLEGRLEEMQLSMEVIQAVGTLPASLEVLNALKPKAPGNLERRIAKEAAIAASPGKGPIRKDAAAVLTRLVRLATSCRELQATTIDGANLQVLQGYTKKGPDELSAKWRANALEVVNSAGSNGAVDEGKVERNELLVAMIQTLPRLVAMEAAVQPSANLQRWADWGLDDRAVEQVLYPTRAAAATAFLSFLNDSTDGMRNWEKVQQDQQPLVNFLIRSIAGAGQIKALNGDLETACAKLMTPLDVSSYIVQRRYTLAMVCLTRPDLEPKAAGEIREHLAKSVSQFR